MKMPSAPAFTADDPRLTLPRWVQTGADPTPQTIALRTGGLLALLSLVLAPDLGVPVPLLVNRLALKAAVVTLRLEGRSSSEGEIRDAFHLTPAGDAMGPDGEALAFWRSVSGGKPGKSLALPDTPIFATLDAHADPQELYQSAMARADSHGPIAGAAHALTNCLAANPRAERAACLMADLILARHCDWPAVFPVSALFLTRPLLREVAEGPDGALKLQLRLLDGMIELHRMARDLARRAAALNAVAPKLRAKTSDAAVALFLTEDAVLPSTMLSPVIKGSRTRMTDRAARRFCDRLIELGVAHELTGRPSFRLYGIAQ